eukprot:Partr_v1_DN25292_c0_g1_i2_m16541 putative GLI pathogenesis-related 2
MIFTTDSLSKTTILETATSAYWMITLKKLVIILAVFFAYILVSSNGRPLDITETIRTVDEKGNEVLIIPFVVPLDASGDSNAASATATSSASSNAETEDGGSDGVDGVAEAFPSDSETDATAAETGETAAETGETAAETGETTAETGETTAETEETPVETGESPSNGTETSGSGDIASLHNAKRVLHGCPDLAWDDTLAEAANTLASQCVFQHSSDTTGFGENIFMTAQEGSAAEEEAVEAWYNEISLYDFNNPVFGESTGHFTQLVWKDSTKVGCAAVKCDGLYSGTPGTFVVCQYQNAGNVDGEFATNVPALAT